MKKFLLFFLLLSFSLIANSQIQIGVKGGYFFYNVPGSGQNSHESASYTFSPDSYLVSVAVNQRTQKTFNVGLELEYITRSYNVNSQDVSPGHSTNGYYHVKFDQFNLLIKPQFVFGHKVKFYVCPGMFVNFFGMVKDHGINYSWFMFNNKQDTTISKPTQSTAFPFAFGLMAGLGIEIPLHNGFNIVCENNYSFNLAGTPPDGADGDRFFDIKFEAGVAYTFKNIFLLFPLSL